MKFGLVGLPNVGKSTIFNRIVGQEIAKASNFPFCTISPNSATAYVMDEKIKKLGEMSKSNNLVFPRLECVDIAGLVRGASSGAGLGNQFLSHIRQVDLILHILRCFPDDGIQHVDGRVNPIEDADLINTELILADIDLCSKILANRKTAKLYSNSQIMSLEKAMKVLEKDKLIVDEISNFTQDDLKFIEERGLITAKPMLYVANIGEEIDKSQIAELELRLRRPIVVIHPLGDQSEIDHLIQESYKALNLITFYTTGVTESRGWSILRGTNAKKASGAIHSDFEKKFIAASIIAYDDFVSGETKRRIEGAEYIVQDCDICEFRIGR